MKITAFLLAVGMTLFTVSARAQDYSAEELTRRATERRAVEAAIWGIPFVNYDMMYQAMVRAHGGFNQLVFWSHPSDWKNQTLTPNTDALYIMPFFNTKDGPIVLQIPPADEGTIVGTIMDSWQTPLEDVGPAGADAGKGGKYLLLPPTFKGKPPAGYIVLPTVTNQGYALLRSIPKSGSEADIAKAVGYMKRINLYPLSSASNPPPAKLIDTTGAMFDANIPYDLRFFESLNRVVQDEQWLERDRAMIDTLKSVGIEKGKPFALDQKTQDILKTALEEAHQWFDMRYESFEPFYPGERWFVPAEPILFKAFASGYTDADQYPVDARGVTYYWGFSSIKRVGASQHQLYPFADLDKSGNPLDGGKTYHLTVPAHVPAQQYWSATAYDRKTHALLRDVARASRSSLNSELIVNTDGSVDIYFGPKAPSGKDSNWIPTKPDGKFEIIFRLYGAEPAAFDKTWKLPDIEEVK
jgi:hypothetical protein